MNTTAAKSLNPLKPGASIGVIGGGQLGRYFVLEARRLGFITWVLDPDENAPAMQIAQNALVGRYDDAQALATIGQACDAITVEFENVPFESLEQLNTLCRVAPSSDCIQVAQDRDLEKTTAQRHGLTPVPYATIENIEDVSAATESVRFPAILKTSKLGYDGKGQQVCENREQVEAAFNAVDQASCVLEEQINLAAEVSVVLARGADGVTSVFPLARNVHVAGILSTSLVPSGLPDTLLSEAESLACQLAAGLNYVGVLAVEFFIDTDGRILFNEMAPRPHNSGHYTLDATVCSQFEQQLRALCELPLGSTELLSPVCMLNVLGDCWNEHDPDWLKVFDDAGIHLHLYGKAAARPGRKMGHINCLAPSAEDAFEKASSIQQAWAMLG